MDLINRVLLEERIEHFTFPSGERKERIESVIAGWQKSLTKSDLKKTKEKSVQGLFLEKFFCQILGYSSVVEGLGEWNYIQHPKTEVDSQEPDGTLGFFSSEGKKTKAVIELKDALTPLDKKQTGREKGYTPVEQAYLYATKFEGCDWIIVSNFIEIRIYHKSKTQDFSERFNILKLSSREELQRFYFTLCKESLISKEGKSPVEVLLNSTERVEKEITESFYNDFRNARTSLLNDLSDQNPGEEQVALLEKTQTLLDRVVFILFCESTGFLLPRDTLRETISRAHKSFSESKERVWSELKGLFKAINEGNPRVTPPINAYNGGLFKPDPELDALSILDESWAPLIKLADYDFATEINVNILGHIFEQSVSDIENLKKELAETEQGKLEEKRRRKEGIYYTPSYITRYMVENSVGNFLRDRPGSLSSITILDPACGSGAFLNQAHTYLLDQYTALFEQKITSKSELSLFEDFNPASANRSILLNNLFGVDLNEESAEITKLSLWLKTARVTEPLQNLDRNIKKGNSLVDDRSIAGSKAFDWGSEFSEIMRSGGFDVVIGNPPWVSLGRRFKQDIDKPLSEYLINKYEGSAYLPNLFEYFIKLGLTLVKADGYFCFIVPDRFGANKQYVDLRRRILTNFQLEKVVFNVEFPNVTADCMIFVIKNSNQGGDVEVVDFNKTGVDIKSYSLSSKKILEDHLVSISLSKAAHSNILAEVSGKSRTTLGDVCEISTGFIGAGSSITRSRINPAQRPIVKGEDIGNFNVLSKHYFEFSKENLKGGTQDEKKLSTQKKILIRKTGNRVTAALDNQGVYVEQSAYFIHKVKPGYSLELLLGVLNSGPINWYYSNLLLTNPNSMAQIKLMDLKQVPIPTLNSDQKAQIEQSVITLITLNGRLQHLLSACSDFLRVQYGIEKKREIVLENDYFVKLIGGIKTQLSLSQKEDLYSWFREKVDEAQNVKEEIRRLQNDVDQIVGSNLGISESNRR